MSIAEKLTTIANNLTSIFNKAKEQRDYEWWDEYQSVYWGGVKDVRKDWRYAFAGDGWNDSTYNPTKDINILSASDDMYTHSWVTDSKVPIKLSEYGGSKTFRNSELVTIRKLIVDEDTPMSQQFTNCGSLENLTIEGTIGTDANFQWCECLTLESMVSIIDALKYFVMDDPDNAYTCTIQFSDDCWDILKTNRPTPDAPTYFEIIGYKGWNT